MQKVILRITALVLLIIIITIGIVISQDYQLPQESEKAHVSVSISLI